MATKKPAAKEEVVEEVVVETAEARAAAYSYDLDPQEGLVTNVDA